MKTINTIMVLFSFLGITGCNSWLDVKPADQVIIDQVFDSEDGFYSALNGIYIEMIKPELYGQTLSFEMLDILAQRYAIDENNDSYKALANFSYTEDYPKGRLETTWNSVYKLILNCNLILENVEERRELLSEQGYGIIKGEALALRAFLHFDMLRLFGPIYKEKPTALSIPYVENSKVAVSDLLPANEVIYEKILRDLTNAEELLLNSDSIITTGPKMEESIDNTYSFRALRLNYYAVLALKARTYLWAADKENALRYALMVINDSNRENYFPFTSYTDVVGNERSADRIFSSEMLFGLYNTQRSDLYRDYFDEDNAANNLLTPPVGSIEALYAGEENDYRYSIWQSSMHPGDKSLLCLRLKKTETGAQFDYYMPLIRISEMYLIASECANNDNDAFKYLNELRSHRGLTKLITDNLEEHLQNEYNKEFICEGQLFFYYKRKNLESLTSAENGSEISMTEAAYIPSLPESETKYRN